MITGSIPVASLLGTRKGRVVVLGGSVLTDELACVGPVASATVRRYRAELAVLGAAGLSARDGITELDDEAAEIHRLMIEQSASVTVLADGSKLGQAAMAAVAPANRIDVLITDSSAPPSELIELEAVGVRVIVVDRDSNPRRRPTSAAPRRRADPRSVGAHRCKRLTRRAQMQVLTDLFGVQKPLIAMCHLDGPAGTAALRLTRRARAGSPPVRSATSPRSRTAASTRSCSATRTTSRTPPASGVEVAAAMAAVIGRLRAGHPRAVRGQPAVGPRPRASPSRSPPARRSCARSSPACSTATWACWRPTTARSPATATRSAPDTSAVRQHHTRVQPLRGRALGRRARLERRIPGGRCAADLRTRGRRCGARTSDLREAKSAAGEHAGARQHRRQPRQRRGDPRDR